MDKSWNSYVGLDDVSILYVSWVLARHVVFYGLHKINSGARSRAHECGDCWPCCFLRTCRSHATLSISPCRTAAFFLYMRVWKSWVTEWWRSLYIIPENICDVSESHYHLIFVIQLIHNLQGARSEWAWKTRSTMVHPHTTSPMDWEAAEGFIAAILTLGFEAMGVGIFRLIIMT